MEVKGLRSFLRSNCFLSQIIFISCQDDLVGSNAAYVQPLATAYFSLRLFIVEQLMSVNKHSAPQPDELGGDSSLKCSEWLESPLFSHGFIDDPEVLNSPDHRLMLNFIENPAGEDCVTLVKFMQQRVLSDRTGAEKRINHAVHAACAALLWHHGLAAEGLAIVEGKRSSPSAEMVKIWSLGQKIRAFLDEGELQKVCIVFFASLLLILTDPTCRLKPKHKGTAITATEACSLSLERTMRSSK